MAKRSEKRTVKAVRFPMKERRNTRNRIKNEAPKRGTAETWNRQNARAFFLREKMHRVPSRLLSLCGRARVCVFVCARVRVCMCIVHTRAHELGQLCRRSSFLLAVGAESLIITIMSKIVENNKENTCHTCHSCHTCHTFDYQCSRKKFKNFPVTFTEITETAWINLGEKTNKQTNDNFYR